MASIVSLNEIKEFPKYTRHIVQMRDEAPRIMTKKKAPDNFVGFYDSTRRFIRPIRFQDKDYGIKFRVWDGWPTDEDMQSIMWMDEYDKQFVKSATINAVNFLTGINKVKGCLIYENKKMNKETSIYLLDSLIDLILREADVETDEEEG